MPRGKKSPGTLPVAPVAPPRQPPPPAETGQKRGRGGPALVVTDTMRGQVLAYAQLGFSQVQIAEAIGISVPTLRKYFRDEITQGSANLHERILKNMVRLATTEIVPGKNVIPAAEIRKAGEFLLATRFGYAKTTKTEFGLGDDAEKAAGTSPADRYKPAAFLAIFEAAWGAIAAAGSMGGLAEAEEGQEP